MVLALLMRTLTLRQRCGGDWCVCFRGALLLVCSSTCLVRLWCGTLHLSVLGPTLILHLGPQQVLPEVNGKDPAFRKQLYRFHMASPSNINFEPQVVYLLQRPRFCLHGDDTTYNGSFSDLK